VKQSAALAAGEWVKAPTGWLRWTRLGRWRIRGPIWGKPMYWLYLNGSRVTATPGDYNTAVSFPTVAAAKRYVDQQEGAR
jgi:hypothetical protein